MTVNYHWQTFESRGRSVEGRVYEPDVNRGDMILFCPGFTGMGSTLFEQRHVINLLSEGFGVTVLRHKGIRLDTSDSEFLINCSRRMDQARERGEKFLGGGPATLDDWMHEPLVALDNLSKRYVNMVVLGSSFGILPVLWSLARRDTPGLDVGAVIAIGGMQGITDDSPDDIMRVWSDDFLASDALNDMVALDSPQELRTGLQKIYAELPYCVGAIPGHIRLTYLVVENDEIVTPEDTRRFMEATDNRGVMEMDSVDHARPGKGILAHDMPDYPSYYLVERIKEARQRRA